jgi:hypothetical protein
MQRALHMCVLTVALNKAPFYTALKPKGEHFHQVNLLTILQGVVAICLAKDPLDERK